MGRGIFHGTPFESVTYKLVRDWLNELSVSLIVTGARVISLLPVLRRSIEKYGYGYGIQGMSTCMFLRTLTNINL